MSVWLQVVLPVALGFAVNESCDISPWLARKMVRRAAAIRRPDRAEGLAEEWSAVIEDRPGKLFKLFTALGFLLTALAHRAANRTQANRRQANRPGFGWIVRVHLSAAAGAAMLSATTWTLITFLLPAAHDFWDVIVFFGGGLLLLTMLAFVLPSPKSVAGLVCVSVLPTVVLVLLVYVIDLSASEPWSIAIVFASGYGVAHVVRASLERINLSTGVGSVIAASAVLAAVEGLVLADERASDSAFYIVSGQTGVGVLAGLHAGAALLFVTHARSRWQTAPLVLVPDVQSKDGSASSAET